MLRPLATATPQLLAAQLRAGAVGALGSGLLRRAFAALVEPTAFRMPGERPAFQFTILQSLLQVLGCGWFALA